MRLWLLKLAAVFLALWVAACAQQPMRPEPSADRVFTKAYPISWQALPGWKRDSLDGVAEALKRTCPHLRREHEAWEHFCAALEKQHPSDDLRRLIEEHLQPWVIEAESGKGLLTGYYEPLLEASRTRQPGFETPLWGVPSDLIRVALEEIAPATRTLSLRGRLEGHRLVPYWTRAEIEAMGEAFPAPILLWLRSPFDRFVAEVQGSARVVFPDQSHARIGFADHNGHPFRSVTKLLIEQGRITPGEAHIAGLRRWFAQEPHLGRFLLQQNPRVIFFRELPELSWEDGPLGSLGVALIAGRSIAVDPLYYPLGAPFWLIAPEAPDAPLARLVVAMDTGSAIKGPLRADFFWGSDQEAERRAWRTRSSLQLWIIWPKGSAPLLREERAP